MLSNNHQIAKNFGNTLKGIRADKNLTQFQLSENSGLSLRMISDMERGIKQPSLGTLIKLARGLDMKQGFGEAA